MNFVKNKTMGIFNLFKNKSNQNILDYKSKGAIILDVRTRQEYNTGAIKGSKHIALQDLPNHILALQKLNTPFIVCCASGLRSSRATKLLISKNIDAINGGGWQSLACKIK